MKEKRAKTVRNSVGRSARRRGPTCAVHVLGNPSLLRRNSGGRRHPLGRIDQEKHEDLPVTRSSGIIQAERLDLVLV